MSLYLPLSMHLTGLQDEVPFLMTPHTARVPTQRLPSFVTVQRARIKALQHRQAVNHPEYSMIPDHQRHREKLYPRLKGR